MLFPYRKKALSCHPDKNPNDEQAGDTFHQLTEALTILTNPKSRKSYDNLLKSRKLANSGRQKIKIVRTAPEREYNKNETTDEDEENELYDHPDFENVKVLKSGFLKFETFYSACWVDMWFVWCCRHSVLLLPIHA